MMMTDDSTSLLEDKYDALAQRQERNSNLVVIVPKQAPEAAGAAGKKKKKRKKKFSSIFYNHHNQYQYTTKFVSLAAWTTQIEHRIQEGLCIKVVHPPHHHEESFAHELTRYDEPLSWQLSYEQQPFSEVLQPPPPPRNKKNHGNQTDDSTLVSLERARKDRYAMLTGSSISALETDSELEVEKEEEEKNIIATAAAAADQMEDEGVEPPSDVLDAIFAAKYANKKSKRSSSASDHFMLDEKLTIEFVMEDDSDDDNEERKTNGVLDKYSTTKDVTAFERMMDKLGLGNHDAKEGGEYIHKYYNSNHTRTTAASTVLESTGHSRSTVVSLDAIFTLNSSIILTVRSLSTEEEHDDEEDYQSTVLGDHDAEKDDDSSAWFGFRENCDPNVAVLLDPVSTDDGSVTLFSMYTDDYNDDEYNQSDALTGLSVDSEMVLRSESDLPGEESNQTKETAAAACASTTATTTLALNLQEMIQKMTEMVSPKFSGNFFAGDESEFLPNNIEETEIVLANDEAQVQEEEEPLVDITLASPHQRDEDDTSMHMGEGRPVVESVLRMVEGIRNWNDDLHEPHFCCSCNDPNLADDLDESSSIMEEEDAIEQKKQKQKDKRKIEDGCKDTSDNTSDEEGEGGVAVLVTDDSYTATYKILPSTEHDDDVEIMLKQYEKAVTNIDQEFQMMLEMESASDSDESSIETKPSEEVQSLLDHPDFTLGVIVECEHSGSDEEIDHNCVPVDASNEGSSLVGDCSFPIETSPSDNSFCIPSPPNGEGTPMEGLSNTLSCDSFELSMSSDDMSIPPVKHSTHSVQGSRSSHRRRHTLDHIPSYHTLFDFKKPVVLPFLQEENQYQDDSSHSVVSLPSLSSNSKPVSLSIKTSFHEKNTKLTLARPVTPTGTKLSGATHKRSNNASFLTIWNDIHDENTPTNRSICSATNSSSLTPRSNGTTKSNQQQSLPTPTNNPPTPKERPTTTTAPSSTPTTPKKKVVLQLKGILRKEGCDFGTGRRIRWNEEQLTDKEEKGILHSSGRTDPRSVCPLDQLVQELSVVTTTTATTTLTAGEN